MYSAYPTQRGEVVSVQHINSERDEKTDDEHTERAFCEMWLLGFTQNLITSANSTFRFEYLNLEIFNRGWEGLPMCLPMGLTI